MPTSLILKLMSAVTVTLLLLSFCIITASADETVDVFGNADVEIKSVSSAYSQGAAAAAALDGSYKAVLKSELFCPGAWANFCITVENRGSGTARLSEVIKQDNTSDDIMLSFGISDSDIGEMLAAGDTCTITVVAQVNPELSSSVLEENGDFSLTLIYDTDFADNAAEAEDNPKTGDNIYCLVFCIAVISVALISLLSLRRRRGD